MKLKKISFRMQILIIIILVVIIRLGLAWIFGAEVADISNYHRAADIIGRGDNIYTEQGIFPYTPIAMFMPYWCLILAQFLQLPYHFIIKWPTILADLGVALLLWKHVLAKGSGKRAFLIGLAYAINPVSILITAFHGSNAIIQIFFSLFAYILLMEGADKRYYILSALSLGIAIGFRGFPVLFVPFFLFKIRLDWKRKAYYLVLAALPSVVTLAPFLIANFQSVWRELFSYSGLTDYGWIAAARSFWFIVSNNMYLPGTMGDDLLNGSKWVFLLLYILYVVYFWRKSTRFSLLSGILGTILLFFGIYGGISSQYLVWIIPFALLSGSAWEKYFTWSATIALIGFYLFYFPTILFGNLPVRWPEGNPSVMVFTLVSNLVLWCICLFGLYRVIIFPPPDPVNQEVQVAVSLEEVDL